MAFSTFNVNDKLINSKVFLQPQLKIIVKELYILWEIVKTIIVKWRKYGTAVTLPRTERPPKSNDKTRRKLV